MTFLDRLERWFAPFALTGLLRYVVIGSAFIYVMISIDGSFASALVLDPKMVAKGEVWRLGTWIFLPQTLNPLFTAIYLMWVWWMGDALEAMWGTFRINVYYLLGVVLNIVAAFTMGATGGALFLNLTLLLALATLDPDTKVLFFFVIPMKMKWLAVISLFFPASALLFGAIPVKIAILLCFANYLLFFGPQFFRATKQNREVKERRARFEAAKLDEPALHRCATCGKTEITDFRADFRVAADGNEYCSDHLPTLPGKAM